MTESSEQKENLLTTFLLALATSFLVAGWSFASLPFGIDALLSSEALPGSWQKYIHFSHNAYHSWRIDPVLGLSALIDSLLFPLATTMICFTAGTTLYLHLIHKSSALRSLLLAVFTSCLLVHLFALDSVLFGSICWAPWIMILLHSAARKTSLANSTVLIVLALFVGLRLSNSANHLSLWILFLAPLMPPSSAHLSRVSWACLIALALPCLAPSLAAPVAAWPDYPQQAALVADDGLAGHLFPLLASGYPQPSIDRTVIKELLWLPSLALVLLSLGAYVFSLSTASLQYTRLSIGLSILCALDTLLPEHLASIMPLAAVARVLPGMSFIPLAPAVFLFALYLILLQLFAAHTSKKLLGLIPCLIIPITGLSSSVSPGLFQSPRRTLSHKILQEATPSSDSANKLLSKELVVSPSHQLLRDHGGELLLRTNGTRNFIRGRRFIDGIKTSHRSEPRRVRRMLDGKVQTRWSPGKESMTGDEWIYLNFHEPLMLDGIELSTGKFPSDFPAAVRISVPECQTTENFSGPNGTAARQLKEITEANPWKGAINLTKSGFPYRGWQGTVRLKFAEISTGCLIIEQIGSREYDWSVSEVRLSGPDIKPNEKKLPE